MRLMFWQVAYSVLSAAYYSARELRKRAQNNLAKASRY